MSHPTVFMAPDKISDSSTSQVPISTGCPLPLTNAFRTWSRDETVSGTLHSTLEQNCMQSDYLDKQRLLLCAPRLSGTDKMLCGAHT